MSKWVRFVSFTLALALVLPSLWAKDQKKAAAQPSAEDSPAYSIGLLPFQDTSGSDCGAQLKDALAKQLQSAILNGTNLVPKMITPGADDSIPGGLIVDLREPSDTWSDLTGEPGESRRRPSDQCRDHRH